MHQAIDVIPSHRVGGYHEFAPPPDLGDAVEALWIHKAPDVYVVRHRVVPDAAVSLCFVGRRAPDGSAGDARLRLVGPVMRPRMFAPPAGHLMESVRIKLEWCRSLLGVAPWEHADAEEELYADVRPDLAAPLESRLARTTNSVDALRVFVDFLRTRREAHPRRATLLAAGMESLRHGTGQPRVAELAGQLGVSDRHLRRLMIHETGIAPRHFARIQRFHALLRSADAAPRPAWAALAFRHGYADQPHLIREAQELAGVTPARLHAERRAE